MRIFLEYWLRRSRNSAAKDPMLMDYPRDILTKAIEQDDRRTILAFARAWPEIFITPEYGYTPQNRNSYIPTAHMGYKSSLQTILEVAKTFEAVKFSPNILDATNLWGNTLVHYAGDAGRPDILEAISDIKPDALRLINKNGQTPFDLLRDSLESKIPILRERAAPLPGPS